ncbi:MAG: carbohydrate kinase [Acidobacteria bacterium]|nr:carbohydrate kinase [Acidobacteriota bacterium]
MTETIHHKTDSRQFTIVGIGEVLWDVLPTGKMPGGAPANFAYISKKLGDATVIASRVGSDPDGDELITELAKCGAASGKIQIDPDYPTGRVEVELNKGIPSYDIKQNVAWDNLQLTEDWLDLAQNCDAICFGTLAQRDLRSRETTRKMLDSVSPTCLKIFDVNLRLDYFSFELLNDSLDLANVLKLNREELILIAEMFGIDGKDEVSKLIGLKNKFEIETACVTLGGEGSILVSVENVAISSGIKINAIDTIGAGDAFTAALTHGLLRKWDIEDTNKFANRVGGFVASRKGAMPKIDLALLPV